MMVRDVIWRLHQVLMAVDEPLGPLQHGVHGCLLARSAATIVAMLMVTSQPCQHSPGSAVRALSHLDSHLIYIYVPDHEIWHFGT